MSVYVPPQHGAWAFLGLPLVLGAVVVPWTPLLLLLAVAWVAAYPWSYAALGAVRSPHPERFRRPLLVWSVVVAAAGGALLLARPWLVWVGLVMAAAFAVNLRYARANDERALANDLVFVGECAAMVAVTWAVAVGASDWSPPPVSSMPVEVRVLVAVCALVLVGSTLHVKSLIRERRDPRYARASVLLAALCLPVAIALAAGWGLPAGWWLVVPFVALLARAVVVPRRRLAPRAVGLVELGLFILTAVCAMLAA